MITTVKQGSCKLREHQEGTRPKARQHNTQTKSSKLTVAETPSGMAAIAAAARRQSYDLMFPLFDFGVWLLKEQ
eukprot:scaffold6437_cov98-Skeletonema_dohrnii-CCMP3373.AAC.5